MIRASSILFWFALTIAVSLGLYHTSYHVQELRAQLKGVNAQIEAEQGNIHVLKAEWVYLANPARIEDAARKHLALQPTALKQIAKLDKLPGVLPARVAAADDKLYVNTRMNLQRTASAAPLPAREGHIVLANFGSAP